MQIPSGQGGWPSQPDLILQLMFSKAANLPLQDINILLQISPEFMNFSLSKKIIKQLPTCQLHQSACEGMRGMTCASPVGQGGSGSLRQKADKNIEKLNNPLS